MIIHQNNLSSGMDLITKKRVISNLNKTLYLSNARFLAELKSSFNYSSLMFQVTLTNTPGYETDTEHA